MKKISVSGKGGTGKSVTVTLLANAFSEAGYTVLTVDSDESNPGLYMMMGFSRAPRAFMDALRGKEDISGNTPGGVDVPGAERETALPHDIHLKNIGDEYILARGNIRLLSAGKITEAMQGCACPLGMATRSLLERLVLEDNEIAIVDTEAGVEHFGRGIERSIDTALAVVEPSFESLVLATKVHFMARGSGIKNIWAILNKVPSPEVENTLREELARRGVRVAGTIHYDSRVTEDCFRGRPLGASGAQEDAREIARFLLQQPA